MKNLRQLHLYLGCLFAPLIIYFSISGMWQVFRLNDVPEEGGASTLRLAMHELSEPHTHSTLPGGNSKTDKSQAFNWIAVAMGLGMTITSILGIVLAIRFSKRPIWPIACILAGAVVPWLFLFLKK